MTRSSRILWVAVLVAVLFLVPWRAAAQTLTGVVPVGTTPTAMAANPVTNKIYVANKDNNNVTVVDGATNATSTINAGTLPFAVALNPVTNQVYVASNSSNNVTVIDAGNSVVATVSVGINPSH
jgi:YVTN family beta-propeller protein